MIIADFKIKLGSKKTEKMSGQKDITAQMKRKSKNLMNAYEILVINGTGKTLKTR